MYVRTQLSDCAGVRSFGLAEGEVEVTGDRFTKINQLFSKMGLKKVR